MALVLTVETGAGLSNSNSYATDAQAYAYHEAHVSGATYWPGADQATREVALVMATRLIDDQFQFRGRKVKSTQALQWPRTSCPDPDAPEDSDGFVASSVVPKALMEATCEMARELIIKDRTLPPAGEGEKYHFDGATQIGWDKNDTPPVISKLAQAMLCKYGDLIRRRCGSVTLIRC